MNRVSNSFSRSSKVAMIVPSNVPDAVRRRTIAA
jgi:hypothetical protein